MIINAVNVAAVVDATAAAAVAEDAQCTRMIKCSSARAGRAETRGRGIPCGAELRLYS